MSRPMDFPRSVRREALDRSRVDGMPRCEAVGAEYGLPAGQRCYIPLAKGFEVHHVKEAEYGGDNSLGNALCICRLCHRFVTRAFVQGLRKADRVRDKASGAFKPSSRPMPGSKASGWRKPMNRHAVRRSSGDDDAADLIIKAARK